MVPDEVVVLSTGASVGATVTSGTGLVAVNATVLSTGGIVGAAMPLATVLLVVDVIGVGGRSAAELLTVCVIGVVWPGATVLGLWPGASQYSPCFPSLVQPGLPPSSD